MGPKPHPNSQLGIRPIAQLSMRPVRQFRWSAFAVVSFCPFRWLALVFGGVYALGEFEQKVARAPTPDGATMGWGGEPLPDSLHEVSQSLSCPSSLSAWYALIQLARQSVSQAPFEACVQSVNGMSQPKVRRISSHVEIPPNGIPNLIPNYRRANVHAKFK